jgi:hypothetical protein
MEYIKKTKWNREKIEEIMNKLGLEFESNDNGFYLNAYIKAHGKKGNIQIYVQGSTITMRTYRSCWGKITSYKKFEYALKRYIERISEELWQSYFKNLRYQKLIK